MSTVTVAPTVDATHLPPRVRLDVTDTGAPALTSTTVLRINPDGSQSTVRTVDGNPLVLSTSGSNQVGLAYDYEMPLGAAVQYTTTTTPTAVSAAVTVTSAAAWLVHVGVPSLSRTIRVREMGDRTRKVAQAVLAPMGRRYPVALTDGARKASTYALTLMTVSDSDRSDLRALLDDAGVLLLNVPATKSWGVTSEYVAIGDATEGRILQYGPEQRRAWTLPCTVVDRPDGGAQSDRTLATVEAEFATLAAAQAAYPTLYAAEVGP